MVTPADPIATTTGAVGTTTIGAVGVTTTTGMTGTTTIGAVGVTTTTGAAGTNPRCARLRRHWNTAAIPFGSKPGRRRSHRSGWGSVNPVGHRHRLAQPASAPAPPRCEIPSATSWATSDARRVMDKDSGGGGGDGAVFGGERPVDCSSYSACSG